MSGLSAIILLSVFKTVEFYVIVSVIAAAVVGFMALPARRSEVKLHMLAGDLRSTVGDADGDEPEAAVTFIVHDEGLVELRRTGLPESITTDGAVSIAVKVSGFDIEIEERLTAGRHPSFGHADTAIFILDFLAPEWYHIKYNSETSGEFAALTLHVRPGIRYTKRLMK